jgi:DNA polymerase I
MSDNQRRKSFYIIDGHAHIYRAYFAPFRDLTSPTGEPTKATFVFTQRLLNLIESRKPDYLAMVIDSNEEGTAVYRKELYPHYKASRKERPNDFTPQEQRILHIVKDAGIPIFAQPGYEADDVIATMAKKLCDKGFDIYMASSDKDLRQVVNDCTWMYDAYTDEVFDAAKIEEKCGFTPAQAIEVQTLTGDAIDDIPGIPGVGPKTAAKLVQKYGTADAVLQHLDELTPKLREAFEQNAHFLPVARQLVTLRTDLEFDFDAEQCRFTGVDTGALARHLKELGFTSLLKRLGADAEADAAPAPVVRRPSPLMPVEEGLFGPMTDADKETGQPSPALPEGVQTGADCRYCCIHTDDDWKHFLADLKKQDRFAFDTETDGLDPVGSRLVGMSFSWEHGTGYYVPVLGPEGSIHPPRDKVLKALKPILENERVKKVGHNIKYDILVMRQAGVAVRGVEMDSMVAAFLLDASRMQYGIDRLALDLLNFKKVATVELIGKGKTQITMDKVDLPKIACYAAEDADIALRLCDLLRTRLKDYPAIEKLNDDLETPLIDVLVEMEHNGVAIDPTILKEQSDVLAERIDALRKKILEAAGYDFNPDSPKQLGDVLYNKLKIPIKKRTKTGPSTDVEALDKIADLHPVPALILEYRGMVKLKNTYLDNLTDFVNPRTGRIHGSFNQAGAATGRLSMSDPNLQNIPIRTDEGRRIRLAFVPGDRRHNVLLTADYSQIELRVLAHYTREPALVRAFEQDEDIHTIVASEVFNTPLDQVTRQQRGYAKTINFGIIYGVSAYGLARRIEGLSVQAAGELITAYNKRFPAIQKFLEQCVQKAQADGYVETILGRRRPIPDISSGVIALRNAAERMAINSVVQGSAADLIKVAMRNLHRRLAKEKRPSKLLLQVHDELVFETPQDAAEADAGIVREEMVNAGKELKLTVPLKVEVGWGKNWQEVK